VYFGDKCEDIDLNYLGLLSNEEVQVILKKTKYSIISEENFYSFYSIECISNHVNIFHNKQVTELELIKNNKKMIEILFEDFEASINKINESLENYKNQDFPYEKFDFNFN
jgi:iron uptake system EfeUOB component EfeO/EfeM